MSGRRGPTARRGMTKEGMPKELTQALRAARAHVAAAEQLAGFIERLGPTPNPADIAEYATLLRRERATLDERTDALRAAGLSVPSVDADLG